MQVSENGLKKIAEWEGVKNKVYLDAVGLPTIGVGHLMKKDELTSGKIYILGESVKYANGLTDKQVFDLLDQDLDEVEEIVNKVVTVPLTQWQFDALVAFAYNIGNGAFAKSTLVKLLNQGQYDAVPAQLLRWTKAGGRELKGLVNRRNKEIKVWNGSYE